MSQKNGLKSVPKTVQNLQLLQVVPPGGHIPHLWRSLFQSGWCSQIESLSCSQRVNLLEVQLKLLPARTVFGILQIRPWWWCCSCITMTGEWKNQQKGVLGWSANSNFYRSEIFRLAWKRTGTQVCQTLTEDFIHNQAASICSESLNLVIPRCIWRNVSMRTRYSCGRNARVTKFRWTGQINTPAQGSSLLWGILFQ